MNVMDCEAALIARMAEADGESSIYNAQQVEHHFASCEACRPDLQQITFLDAQFNGLERQVYDVDLWPAVRSTIAPVVSRQVGWGPFVLVGAALLVYKLLEMVPTQAPGLLFNLVPLLGLVVLFILVRENPFNINPEITVEE